MECGVRYASSTSGSVYDNSISVLFSLLTPPSSKTKVIIKIKVQSYEEGNLEIHHSDRSSHTDCHRHQPGGYKLHLLKGSPPLAPPKRRGTEKKEDEQSSSFLVSLRDFRSPPSWLNKLECMLGIVTVLRHGMGVYAVK